MIEWIRVGNDLPAHPKTLKLARLLKLPEAGWYMLTLWAWCSRHAQDGLVAEPDAIEQAVGWRGAPGTFLQATLDAGFLEHAPAGAVQVHDWMEINGAAIRAAVDKAEYLKEYRKRSRTGTEPVREPVPNQFGPVTKPVANQPDVDGDVDENSNKDSEQTTDLGTQPRVPAPEPEGEGGHVPPADPPIAQPGAGQGPLALKLGDVPTPDWKQVVFEHWRKAWGISRQAKLTSDRNKALEKRKGDGYTPEDMCKAIDGSLLDDWIGRPNQNDLTQLLKTTNIDRFMGFVDKPPARGKGPYFDPKPNPSPGAAPDEF